MTSQAFRTATSKASAHTPKPRRRRSGVAGVALLSLGVLLLSACSTEPGAAADTGEHPEHAATASPTPGSGAPAPTDPSGTPAAAAVVITISDDGMSPSDLTITAGQDVTVVNEGQLEHTWTSDEAGIDSGTLAPGDSFTATMTTPGTFSYHCEIHPTMTSNLTVG